MRNITPVQTSFSSGELSPRLYGRIDAAGYASGVQELSNMIADSRGPAVSRDGTRYIANIDGNDGRLFGLSTGEEVGYVFILTDFKLTPVSYDGVPVSENYVLNPDFQSYGDSWTVVEDNGTVDFLPNECKIGVDDVGNASAEIQQEITVPTSGVEYRVAIGERLGSDYQVLIGTTAGGDDIVSETVVGGGNSIFPFTPGATSFWVTVRNEERDTTVELSVVAVIATEIQSDFDTPWAEADLPNLHGIVTAGGATLYFTHPKYPVHKITYVPLTESFVFEEVNFVETPNQWQNENFPRTGVYHEGRLWLGGTPNEPQTFWASKSGQPENFTLGSLADDALTFTMSDRGDIRWMTSTKNLLIGTTLSENIVSSDEGIITPGDIQVTQQSAYGSNRTQAIQVGDQIFYVSADNRKLRAMQYEWSADNWLSNDLTFFSNHITRSGIRYTAWAQNPDNQFICVLDDGNVASLTYERGENIFGWHKHWMGDECKDVSVARVNGTDAIMGLFNRVDGKLYLEIVPVNDQAYMDSWVEVVNDPPVTTVVGLDHLEGREVQVLTDGAVHPNRTVVGGIIELDYAAELVRVGLGFTASLTTLPLEVETTTGSSKPHMKRFNRLYVELIESANPLINGDRQPTRFPSTPMNTPEPPRTGISDVGQFGWDKYTIINIQQDLPLPLNIVSIYGELGQDLL